MLIENFFIFLDSLKYMGVGLAGIFIIISLIVGLIKLMMKLFPPSGEK